VIVVDTGALLALMDRDEAHHDAVRGLFEGNGEACVVPWAVLPEVDYLASTHLGSRVHALWLDDLATGFIDVHWGGSDELVRAREIQKKYRALKLGLVDAVVMAAAEALGASAIATLDLRHFGAVSLKGTPKLYPRDL
jgi:uncharacterized protein